MLATDGSFHANNATEQVIEFQKQWNCEVVIFHSTKHHKLPIRLYPDEAIPIEIYRNIEDVSKKAGKELLDKAKYIFSKEGLKVETRLIEDFAPEVYIRKIVEEEHFDLVVLGSKGHHSKLKEILLGTVSTKVVNSVPCDVLLVK
ncbi:MAG: universal stress protein [Candidatus Hodarchaeota archaeon]